MVNLSAASLVSIFVRKSTISSSTNIEKSISAFRIISYNSKQFLALSKGPFPVAIVYKVIPAAHMSAGLPRILSFLIIYGEKYFGVPS
jgi:hypothetical protein